MDHSTCRSESSRPLRILYSAYACEPGKGSEPGIGWHWARESAALGHEVWVVTRRNNQAGIEALSWASPNLHFLYYDLPRWGCWWKRGGRGVHLYYLLWQWFAYRRVRSLHERRPFDVVHHITFGVLRQASFMGRLGIPLILGPLGGAERAPLALRRHYPLRGWLLEGLRDLANILGRYDPSVRAMFRRAALILVKTPESMAWLPAPYRHKAQCMLEIGIETRVEPSGTLTGTPVTAGKVLKLVYVGRFLPLKGMGLGLRALGKLRSRGVGFHLTMIGQGPERQRWQTLSGALGIADSVTWVPWMSQVQLLQAYRQFDLLLFPSLHDSSGNVVLEALAQALPVVCLELGGPARIVDNSCGQIVPVSGCNEQEVIDRLCAVLNAISEQPGRIAQLRAGAVLRARSFEWPRVLAEVWGAGGHARRLVSGASHDDSAAAIAQGGVRESA